MDDDVGNPFLDEGYNSTLIGVEMLMYHSCVYLVRPVMHSLEDGGMMDDRKLESKRDTGMHCHDDEIEKRQTDELSRGNETGKGKRGKRIERKW